MKTESPESIYIHKISIHERSQCDKFYNKREKDMQIIKDTELKPTLIQEVLVYFNHCKLLLIKCKVCIYVVEIYRVRFINNDLPLRSQKSQKIVRSGRKCCHQYLYFR